MRMLSHKIRLGLTLTVLAIIGSSCSGDGTTEPEPPIFSASIITGDAQTGAAGSTLPVPLKIQLSRQDDRNASNVPVKFVVTAGTGQLTEVEVLTDAQGQATTQWSLGTIVSDSQRVDLYLGNDTATSPQSLATFRAQITPAAPLIAVISGSGQTALAGSPLPDSLVVRVADEYGNPIPNKAIQWAVVDGSGSVTPTTGQTDADGYASARWSLGPSARLQKVTAKISELPSVEFVAVAEVPAPDITTRIHTPITSALVRDTLSIVATVQSTYVISTVNASVGSLTVPLVFHNPSNTWRGNIPLADLPFGTLQLVVTAADVRGSPAVAAVNFRHHKAPQLIIESPARASIASLDVHVKVRCVSVYPEGCTQIRVTLDDMTMVGSGTQVAEGRSNIDQTVSLAAYEGSTVMLTISATDESRDLVWENHDVSVMIPQNMILRKSFSGYPLDIDGSKVLVKSWPVFIPRTPDTLRIWDGALSQTIFTGPGMVLDAVRLTAAGAVFGYEQETPARKRDIIDYRSGSTIQVGELYLGGALVLNDKYAIWRASPSSSLKRRNLLTGVTNTVDLSASCVGYDIGPTGNAACWNSALQVLFFPENGALVTVTSNSDFEHRETLTNETRILYQKKSKSQGTYQIALWTAEDGEIALTSPSSVAAMAKSHYQLNNGWIVYTQFVGGGDLQIHTRSPENIDREVTTRSRGSSIEALGPNGEVVFRDQLNKRYVTAPPYSTITPLSYAHGRPIWRNGKLFLLIANSIFEAP